MREVPIYNGRATLLSGGVAYDVFTKVTHSDDFRNRDDPVWGGTFTGHSDDLVKGSAVLRLPDGGEHEIVVSDIDISVWKPEGMTTTAQPDVIRTGLFIGMGPPPSTKEP